MKFRLSFLVILFAISNASLSQITITFTIDMSGQSITPQGVHIAGQFALVNATSITQNWQPGAPGSLLTLVSGSVYSIQVIFPSSSAGKKLEFQFVRNNIWFGSEDFSEGNPGDPNAHLDNSCGVLDGTGGYNRLITIPACAGEFNTVWNYCGTLSPTSPPSLTVSANSQICAGQSVQLSATSNGVVEWSPSTGITCTLCNNPTVMPTTSTLYQAKSSIGNCSVTDSVLITVDGVVTAGPDQYMTPGASTQLSANGATSYTWQPTTALSCINCSSPVASPTVTTTYIVTGTSASGCKSSDTVKVFVSKSPCGDIFFPKAFTPNDDGTNDKFGPLVSNLLYSASSIFRIYNRWGEVIFETKDLNEKWDGRSHGVVQGTGSYVYYLSMDCHGNAITMKGIVTLIR